MRKTGRRIPVPVGEFLKEDFMPDYGLNAPALAALMNIDASRLRRLLAGGRCSAELALRLAKVFGTEPQYWMRLQNHFDLVTAQPKVDLSKTTRLSDTQ